MPRLFVHAEGQTELAFVHEVLRPHLLSTGYWAVSSRILGNPRRQGGIPSWAEARREILGHLREDVTCIATTMVDYYDLPTREGRAWPGREEAALLRSEQRAQHVEAALRADLFAPLDDARRFVPFVMMHEFEALLFSDCAAFSRGIARPELEADLQRIKDQFPTPEDIDDSPITAPSKRVLSLVPRYQKPLLGVRAAQEIGLPRIRQECRHFNDWIIRLEAAASL